MVDLFRSTVRSAYNLQKQQGSTELLKQSYYYIRTYKKDHLCLECDNVSVCFDTSSRTAKSWFYPRYLDGTLHESKITKKIVDTLNEDSVFYDVGGNIGYYTIFASEVCSKGEGEVHMFEIDPDFTKLTKKSLKENSTTATVNNSAVSNKTGDTVSYSGEFGKTSIDSTTTTGSREVDTITIDDYATNNPNPDVMKIDVEGFERHVLEGAERVLEEGYPETMFLEIHPQKIQNHGGQVQDVLNLIDSYGYNYTPIENHRNKNAEVQELQKENLEDIGNIMLVCET